MSVPLVTLEEAREVCGRKFVEQRRNDLETLLLRAFGGSPKHPHYASALALNFRTLRDTFGEAAVPSILARYFERVGAHLKGKWSTAYRLNGDSARRVEHHLAQDDPLSRKPFAPTVRAVGNLLFPDQLPVDLSQLGSTIDRVRDALQRHGEDTYFAASLGSSLSLGTAYRQLLSVRRTVIETGGLPATYRQTKDGRWGGAHDHHPLRLPRPTRYLALGPRPDLWDVDLSNAHLAIALGLTETWFPEVAVPMLKTYLQHRNEWLDALCRALPEASPEDAKSVPRAWLYGSKRTNPGSRNQVIRSRNFPAVLGRLGVWARLYKELRTVAGLLTPESPLAEGAREGTRLSYLLTTWETRIMERLGQKLVHAGVKLEAWLYDGFLLIQSRSDPTERLEVLLAEVADDLKDEGFRFESLGLKVRSVAKLHEDVAACVEAPRIKPCVSPNGSIQLGVYPRPV